MIKKRQLVLPITLLGSLFAQAQVQKDTIWTNYLDQKTIKEDAVYYKFKSPISKKENEISTFTLDHKLHSKGIVSSQDASNSKYIGTFKIFEKDGRLLNKVTYVDGNADGQATSILKDGTTIASTYKENKLYDGTFVVEYNDCYTFIDAEEGAILKLTLQAKEGKNYRQVIYFKDEIPYLTETFDKDGSLLSALEFDEDYQAQTGNKYTFAHNPFRISQIDSYESTELVSTILFYSDGSIKSKTTMDSPYNTTTFFDKNQKNIGVFKTSSDYENPYNEGKSIIFHFDEGKEDFIRQIDFYKDNAPTIIEEYNDRGILKETTTYLNANYGIKKIEYWNEDGSLKTFINYDEEGYSPWDGTFLTTESKTTYKEGTLVEEVHYYSTGEVFELKKDRKSTYYDKKGKVLSTLTYSQENDGSYWTPIEGKSLSLTDGKILSETQYKDGETTYLISYRIVDGKRQKEQEVFYKDGAIVKHRSFNENGTLKKEELFEDYQPVSASYYDSKGKSIGQFDFKKQHGTLIEFFDNGKIKSIQHFENGKKLSAKNYVIDYSATSLFSFETPEPSLQSEIDFYKSGKFYAQGKLISTVSYKEGLPYEGTVYEQDEYQLTVTNYKKGLKDQEEVTYSIFNPEEITSRTYYHLGIKEFEEEFQDGVVTARIPFVNDEYHGEAIYFNTEGTEISRLEYQEGVPYQGIKISQTYNSETRKEVYEEGTLILIEEKDDMDNLIYKKEYDATQGISSVEIYDTETNKMTYSYQMTDEFQLTGTVTYYENNKIVRQAKLDRGQLISGTLAMAHSTYNPETPDAEYFVLTKKKNKISYQLFNSENEKIASYEIKSKKDDAKAIPFITPLTRDNLYPYNERNNYYY